MPIDPYSPCPGGTGKKVKFCCTDLVQELDKVQSMLDGDQPAACLDYVRKLDEQYPGRACLQSIRLSLESAVGDHAAAEATLASFLAKHPGNPVALAEKALLVATYENPSLEVPGFSRRSKRAARKCRFAFMTPSAPWLCCCFPRGTTPRRGRICSFSSVSRRPKTNGRWRRFCNSKTRLQFRCR